MKYKTTLMAIMVAGMGINEGLTHDFMDTTGATVVASYDLTGTELWHGFFMKPNRFLAVPINESQRHFRYINYPRYSEQTLPEHRLVCDLQGRPGNNDQDRCKDEFPHVHFDDFKIAMNHANELCAAYGASIVPSFQAPNTFVGYDQGPAASHHYFYQLSHGLKFDCVALAVD